jgi:ABC-type nitrate/sulfonate/bicarbonate transport system substrate-binding protein
MNDENEERAGASADGRSASRAKPALSRREFMTGAGVLGVGAALGALTGCAPTSGVPGASTALPGAGNTAAPAFREASAGAHETRLIGSLQKTKLLPHVTKVYDPSQVDYAAMDGEPSRNHFFKPVADEGVKDRNYPEYDDKTFKFLALSGPVPVPQTYYMFDKDGGTLNPALAKDGYKAVRIFDQGHIKILPNLYVGYYDFAYITTSALAEYWSGNESMSQELWKRGDDYVVVAGSTNGGIWLLAPPSVTGLKDLDGKAVGIMNPSFNVEALLAKGLAKYGLAPESIGGTVGLEMGSPGRIMNDLLAGKLGAVFSWSIYTMQLQKSHGYRVLAPWDELGFGTSVPNMVLVVRRDILEKHPEVVQKVVQLNYDATAVALRSSDYKAPLDEMHREFQTEYMGHLPADSPGAPMLDAQAGPAFLKEVVSYMTKAGYFAKPYTFKQLVDESFYNKVKK